MHSEFVDKTKVVKAAPQANKPAAASAVSNNKTTAKKTNSTGVFSTMQKTAAK